MDKPTITFTITKPLAVLYENDKGYTKEVNMIAWNGADAKLDIRQWAPNHAKSLKGMTFTEDEGRKLMEALVRLYAELDTEAE